MNYNLLISVIIPVYNVENYIRKTLDSVLEQTYKNYEIILVDDGSTDGSGKICDEYVSSCSQIRVIHQNNQGVSVARNVGIKEAKGDYLFFLDGDDWLSSNAFDELVSLVYDDKADIAAINIFNVTNEKAVYLPETTKTTYTSKEAMTMFFDDPGVFGSVNGKLYKRGIFNDLCFPEGQYWEDMHIGLEVLIGISKVIVSRKACLFYRHRENSTTSSKFSKRKLDEYIAITHVNDVIKQINRPDLYAKNQYRMLNYLMKTYIRLSESDLPDKKELMRDYYEKVKTTIKALPLFKWRFKDLKRYLYFRISPKLYKLLVYKN